MLGNISVQTRLILLVVLMTSISVICGVIALTNMNQTVQTLEDVYEDRVVTLNDLKAVIDAYAVKLVDTAHKNVDNAYTWSEASREIAEGRQLIEETWGNFTSRQNLDPREAAMIEAMAPEIARADLRLEALANMVENQDLQALQAFTAGTGPGDLYPVIDPVSSQFSSLTELEATITREIYEQARQDFRTTQYTYVGFLIIALVVVVVLAVNLVRSIVIPLKLATKHCERIAAGELRHALEVNNDDEVGRMIKALNAMNTQLHSVVDEVSQSALSINTGAAEISSGNIHLSQRTEEQASSLEETAASMEQMTATVKQNAANAANANRLALDARHSVQDFESVTDAAQGAMAELTTSSRKISDITSVVDQMAFQTNLLALNASVEAARAGDAGRGFAVVAGEVRVLAQRSAEAAQEIKALIEDSESRIENMSTVVQDVTSLLGNVSSSFKQLASMVADISEAASEQRDGIEQVNTAISQMDSMTQQNAALVEELTAAAKSLEDQSISLEDVMAFFKLEQDRTRGSRLAAPPIDRLTNQLGEQRNSAFVPSQEWDEF